MRAGSLLLVALGCGRPAPLGPPAMGEPPVITQLEVACDPDEGSWRLALETAGWAGEVTTDWTVDGTYLERHRLQSIAFERDGTFEGFELELAIAADWRKADRNRTAFGCADDVDILLTVRDLEGERVDCRAIGPQPDRWASIEGTGTCETPWTTATPP